MATAPTTNTTIRGIRPLWTNLITGIDALPAGKRKEMATEISKRLRGTYIPGLKAIATTKNATGTTSTMRAATTARSTRKAISTRKASAPLSRQQKSALTRKKNRLAALASTSSAHAAPAAVQ